MQKCCGTYYRVNIIRDEVAVILFRKDVLFLNFLCNSRCGPILKHSLRGKICHDMTGHDKDLSISHVIVVS